MFASMCPYSLEKGFAARTRSAHERQTHNNSHNKLTSNRHSVIPKRMIAPQKLPITPTYTISAVHPKPGDSFSVSHLRNMVNLKRGLAFHIKVSISV